MLTFNTEDYKYSIQDFSNVYLGGRLTYQELADREDVPGKIKDAVYRIFLKEISPELTIGEHLFRIKKDSQSYLAYHQIKINIKVICLELKPDKNGKIKDVYDSRDYSLDDFLSAEEVMQNPEIYMVQEISFKKRNLMLLHV